MGRHYTVRLCSWADCQQPLSEVRRRVFIEEQHVPKELEWDEFDELAYHILVTDKEARPIATGRIKADGHIGRMAVLKKYRKQGIGSKILLALLDIAKQQNLKKVYLYAQTSAIGFYKKHGFYCTGDRFMDAGIAHQSMTKKLNE